MTERMSEERMSVWARWRDRGPVARARAPWRTSGRRRWVAWTAALALLGTAVVRPASASTFARTLPDGVSFKTSRNLIRVSPDGSMLVATGNNDLRLAWVAKLDADGDLLWLRTIDSAYGGARGLVATLDGGALVAGKQAGSFEPRLFRFDADGNLLWQKRYDLATGTGEDIYSCIQTADGGFACNGWEGIDPFGAYDTFLLKLDAQGQVQFYRLYGDMGPREDWLRSLWERPGGGYVLGGLAQGQCSLVRLDGLGDVESVVALDITNYYVDCLWTPAPDGSVAVYAELLDPAPPFDESALVGRLDAQDRILWLKHGPRRGQALLALADGGAVQAGSFSAAPPDDDGYIGRFDSQGSLLWERAVGDALTSDSMRDVVLHPDGDLAIFGVSSCAPPCPQPNHMLVLKLDDGGSIAPSCPLLRDAPPTAYVDFATTVVAGTIGVAPGVLTEVASAAVVSVTQGSTSVECSSACPSSTEIGTVQGIKTAGGGARFVWAASADACHASYRVYQSAIPGMRPGAPPGSWPSDPLFVDVSGSDLDGTDLDPQFEAGPSAVSVLYLKVVDVGTDGQEGPVGSYGR